MYFQARNNITFLLINVNNHISLDHFSVHQNLKQQRALLLGLQVHLSLPDHIVPVHRGRALLLRIPVPPLIASPIVMHKLHLILQPFNIWCLRVTYFHL